MVFTDTRKKSLQLRKKAVDLNQKAILITNFFGSKQELDLTVPPNCEGFGRIRHFRLNAGDDWITNPLPILPASKALKLNPGTEIRTQVFQSSICNWNCWYCFVDPHLLKGSFRNASFLTCDKMLELYLQQDNPPLVIDLTGGQPDLTPEWTLWMMEALINKDLEERVFLWSDDNLSNDFLTKYLTEEQLVFMSSYRMYSRVCCFKGIDEETFSLNTNADPILFDNQFILCKKLLDIGFDLYCYLTLTSKTNTDYVSVIPRFFDKLQKINEMLPLRVVPLKIFKYGPSIRRMHELHEDMLAGQFKALDSWKIELQKRFPQRLLEIPITEIKINNRYE